MERDEELLRRSLDGDVGAFGSLVERHESAVCAVSFAVTGDQETAEDVAQDAFVAAWQDLASLRDPRRFKAWACGIARNLARKARKAHVKVEDARSLPDPAPSAEEQLDARAREAAVWASLELLSPTYREPLVLFYRQGRSTREVAEALGLTVTTVEQRLSRGRKQLRAEVLQLVEQTLEDERPRGRISAAVVAGLQLRNTAPKASSTTMKTLLITSAVATSVGLAAYAMDAADPPSTSRASKADGAAAQGPESPEPPASSPGPHPVAKAVAVTDVSVGDDATTPPTVRIARPFEIKTLGPGHVVMDLRGGLSEATGSKRGEPVPIVGHIEGTVLGPNGKALADAAILGGRYITMKFGNELSSQAGVFSGRDGDFSLPVFEADKVGILAAHHELGMSEVTVTKSGEGRVELRLQPFAVFEGRVEESGEGISARLGLLGARKPLLVFSGPTEDDGTFRFGPLPPGSYQTNAAVSSRDEGASLNFPVLHVDLTPGRATRAEIEALEGAALVLESTISDSASVQWVELLVIAGRHDIGSVSQLREVRASLLEEAVHSVGRSCEDAHCGDVSFDGLEAGAYTACRSLRRVGGATELDCESKDLGRDQLLVVRFDAG